MKKIIRIILALLGSAIVYFGLFYALMVPNEEALDDNFEVAYTCVPRFQEGFPMVVDGKSKFYKRASILNRLFLPAEKAHNWFFHIR